ncbi:MAG: hypothetical protein OJF52_000459 [Nitrospira sp.]|jgi:4-hydroxybenzoate polyprenyltransferase|nr:MAG: hypothetical protein OJF52_000459 [Nitrospira sp.]
MKEECQRISPKAHLATAQRFLSDAYLFIRFPVLNFSIMLPLLGAITVSPALDHTQILGLIGVAVNVHCFAYVMNDIIDLQVDRSEPLRQEYPLVRGAIQPAYAFAFSLVQIPVAFLFTASLGGAAASFSILFGVFICAAVYNLRGKRGLYPPLFDAVLGLACSAFVLYGALMMHRTPTALTGALSALVFVLAVMINGVHGAVRDLGNDFAMGARTTAVFLGSSPVDGGGVKISRSLLIYAFLLQAAIITICLIALIYNLFEYGALAWLITMSTAVIYAMLSLWLLWLSFQSAHDKWNMIMFGMLHLVLSLGFLLAFFAFHMTWGVLLALLTAYLVPVLTMWARYGLKWDLARS